MEIIPADIEDYAAAHTSELHPVYHALREETYARHKYARMQVGHLEGRLLKMLAQLTGARRAVEVGTFTGYSALCIAEGMVEGGVLYTLDVDESTNAIAREFWARAPWGGRIEPVLGDARDTLPGIEGPFDLAFIDADKENYIAYWDEIVPKMRPGGLIAVDNVLWSGRVLSPEHETDRAIVAFNAHAYADDRVEQVLLTVRDGILLCRVR